MTTNTYLFKHVNLYIWTVEEHTQDTALKSTAEYTHDEYVHTDHYGDWNYLDIHYCKTTENLII